MNKKRLLKLADLLEADAKKKKGVKFDLGTWASPIDKSGYQLRFDRQQKTVPVNCNTAACAVGLAAISGAFRRSGLTFTYAGSDDDGYRLSPKFGGHTDMHAAAALFGVELSTAEWLFLPDFYKRSTGATGERAVAKRIRGVVAGRAACPW